MAGPAESYGFFHGVYYGLISMKRGYMYIYIERVYIYIYCLIYALQVKDLVKLGLLTLLKRTYYYLMRTYYYLDLLGPKLR